MNRPLLGQSGEAVYRAHQSQEDQGGPEALEDLGDHSTDPVVHGVGG